MSDTNQLHRFHSGLLDTLVHEIAVSVGASAVFVTAEVGTTGTAMLVEYPRTGTLTSSSARTYMLAMDEPVVSVPVTVGDIVVGWAAVVGCDERRRAETERLVTLLARCAAVLLGQPRGHHRAVRGHALWENAARDGYWEWDLESGVARFSRRSLALLQHQGVDRPEKPDVWLDRVHPDDKAALVSALLTATIDSGAAVECEHRIVGGDGSVARVEARAVLEHDDVGRPQRLVGWLCDVTRPRHMETELRNVHALTDLGRLAAGAAHDFNNFLTVIRGHTELALGAAHQQGPVRESLELIRHAAAGASALTQQLLTMRRRQEAECSGADVNEVLRCTEPILRLLAGRGVELKMQFTPHPTRVRADPTHVERILLNLVVNARDAMPSGGSIEIATAHVILRATDDEARPLLLPPGSYVTLTVTDTGTGMDEATRTSIFKPFFTTKPGGRGTGLGLWIVRDIIEQCGGGVDVRTSPGKGTSFVIAFREATEASAN